MLLADVFDLENFLCLTYFSDLAPIQIYAIQTFLGP